MHVQHTPTCSNGAKDGCTCIYYVDVHIRMHTYNVTYSTYLAMGSRMDRIDV